jgi:hypothetical protein
VPNSTPKESQKLDQEKLISTLDLDPEIYKFGFQFKYRNQQFHFYLLITNKETEENTAVYLGCQ